MGDATRPEIVLVRHGETDWSRSGRHTGRTDVPLTDAGRAAARRLSTSMSNRRFERVFTSPLQRASETCRLAGFGEAAEECERLLEWDYGDYEGISTADVRTKRPGWTTWRDGCPGGETANDVGARIDPLVQELRRSSGDVALFGHGHALRVLAARWIELPAVAGERLVLATASVSVLGYERETPAIRRWNETMPA
jgi:broad specificity phosphatase PhoE